MLQSASPLNPPIILRFLLVEIPDVKPLCSIISGCVRHDMLCLSWTESRTSALNKYRPKILCSLQMFVKGTNQIVPKSRMCAVYMYLILFELYLKQLCW